MKISQKQIVRHTHTLPFHPHRYWSLVDEAVDDSQIAPVSDASLERIYSQVPDTLLRQPAAKRRFLDEMTHDYQQAIKKGMLDYVLLDDVEQERLGVPVPDKVRFVLRTTSLYVYAFMTRQCSTRQCVATK